jgi:FeS assembly SUF system protein
MSFFRSRAANQTADTQPESVDEPRPASGFEAQAESQPTNAAEPDAAGADEPSSNGGGRDYEELKADLIAAMKTVYDPEIPVDIYELGLIYAVDINSTGFVTITMTLTTPMCPAAEILPPEVEAKCRAVDGVTDVTLDLVWDPPWDMEMMSDSARLELNL